MAKITYHTYDNKTHTIDVQNGLTVMEGAVQNDIPGIDADCGGGMACATCHIHLSNAWTHILPIKENGLEQSLLEYERGYIPGVSRLSCQIQLTKELDNLTVKLRDNELL